MYRNYDLPGEMEYQAFANYDGWEQNDNWMQPAVQNGWRTRIQERHSNWSSSYRPNGSSENQPIWIQKGNWAQPEAQSEWSSRYQHDPNWDYEDQGQSNWSRSYQPNWSEGDQSNLAASYELQPIQQWNQEPQENPHPMQSNTEEVNANQSNIKDLLGDLLSSQQQMQMLTKQMSQIATSLSGICEERIARKREEDDLAQKNGPAMKEPVDLENLHHDEVYPEEKPIQEHFARSNLEGSIGKEAAGWCDPNPLPSEVPPPHKEQEEKKTQKEVDEVVAHTEAGIKEVLEPADLEEKEENQSALVKRPQEAKETNPGQPTTQLSHCTYHISYSITKLKVLHLSVCRLLGEFIRKLNLTKPEEEEEKTPPAERVPPRPPDLNASIFFVL